MWSTGRDSVNDDYYNPIKMKQQCQKEMAVFITGCDSGFGKEVAIVAAQEGFVVFAACLQESSLLQFKFLSGKVIALRMDVTKDDHIEKAVQNVKNWISESHETRLLHALINNAGIGGGVGVADCLTISSFEKVMDVNFFGVLRCYKAFLPIFKKQAATIKNDPSSLYEGGSRILNIVSMAGLMKASAGFAPYASSKHAAAALSMAMRQELKSFDVQVGMVCPSFHETPLLHNAHDAVRSSWDALPKEVQEEYGPDYVVYFRKVINYAHQLAWPAEVVVQEIVKGLKQRYIPAENPVGLDARTVSWIQIIMPTWLFEKLNELVLGALPVSEKIK